MQCDRAGELVLLAVELETWRAVTLPRESDTAELITVDATAISLQRFAKDVRGAFAAWSASMGVLLGESSSTGDLAMAVSAGLHQCGQFGEKP